MSKKGGLKREIILDRMAKLCKTKHRNGTIVDASRYLNAFTQVAMYELSLTDEEVERLVELYRAREEEIYEGKQEDLTEPLIVKEFTIPYFGTLKAFHKIGATGKKRDEINHIVEVRMYPTYVAKQVLKGIRDLDFNYDI